MPPERTLLQSPFGRRMTIQPALFPRNLKKDYPLAARLLALAHDKLRIVLKKYNRLAP